MSVKYLNEQKPDQTITEETITEVLSAINEAFSTNYAIGNVDYNKDGHPYIKISYTTKDKKQNQAVGRQFQGKTILQYG